MYQYLSNRTEAVTQLLVRLDLARKGWETFDAYKQFHDLVIDRGAGRFERAQVKRLESGRYLPTANIRLTASDSTKRRHPNRHAYRDMGIEWLVGVRLEDEGIWYYPLSVYSLFEDQVDVHLTPPISFPENTEIRSQNGKTISVELPKVELPI